MAAVGGGIYILVTVWSVFFGERLPAGAYTGPGLPPGIVTPPKPIPPGEHSKKATGTLVLVFVFLAAFIAYYFINWKLLSVVWRIG